MTMIIRQTGSLLNLLHFILICLFVARSNAFAFTFASQPSQCQPLTAQWSGGLGPYRLFLIPVGHVDPEIRTIINMEIPANQTSASVNLQFPEGSQFVAVMSDSTGFGTGGTSTTYTVGSGTSGCLPTSPSKADFYMYFASKVPSQCGSFGITWDSGVSDIHIYGIIPGGQSFDLGAPTTGTGFDWTANVRQGTQMFFLAAGANNANGGSTDITTISGGSSGCINAQSPSSTAGQPAGAVSTAAPAASGSAVASGANPTQTAGVTGGAGTTGGIGATGSAGATATAGATGTSGAAPTGSQGGSPTDAGSPTASNSNSGGGNPISTTRGSGGGTVTGDPNLPVATSNSLSDHRPLNLAAIIGGTLGGLTFVILLLLLWLLCARRRRRANDDDDSERLIFQDQHRRTDLLADSAPIMHDNHAYEHDWFRAEPFVPPMSAAEFARRTGGGGSVDGEQEEYRDYDQNQSMSSLGHGAVTNSSAAAAMYGALARTPSYSTSGHGHRGSTQLSHSRISHIQTGSHSHSHNVSHSSTHSPTQPSSPHSTFHTHSRSFSNPFSVAGFTPTSNLSRTQQITPPTPMSTADPFAAAVSRPPPSSWNNQASGSSNVVPRLRQSSDSNRFGSERKSGEDDEENEPVQEGDIVDIPPSYASIKRSSRRVMNP